MRADTHFDGLSRAKHVGMSSWRFAYPFFAKDHIERVVLDVAVEQLRTIRSSTELCDVDGNVVGVFTPAGTLSECEIEHPPSDEELNRIDRGFQGRPLHDILHGLQAMT